MSKTVYKVIFFNQNKVYEIYVGTVNQSNLHGFIELADFIFTNKSHVVVDPHEEKIYAEFGHVNSSYVPVHHVIRIDKVDKCGTSKILSSKDGDVVTKFPSFGSHRSSDDVA